MRRVCVTGALDAKSNLDSKRDIPQVAKDVAEGIELLNHRQQLIKMADLSESGWRVVTEYETNPLASDSDDEKRINRAESRASKKLLKLEQSKRVKKASRLSSWPSSIRVDPVLPSAHRAITSGTSSFSKPGVCFTCGQPGHWKHECPKARQQARADKISDHLVFSEYKTSKDHKVLRFL